MAVEIPEPFKWDESFKVFYDNLDEEHKGLFDGIFKCAEHRSCNDALTSLKTLIDNHFATEEGMMAAKNYESFEGHKKLHDEFKEKLHSLAVPLDDETIHFAKNWLVNHIKATDFEYKGKL